MAKLVSASTTIEIIPYKRETPTSNWFYTIISIEYHIQDQRVRFETPSKGISLQIEELDRLITEAKNYVKALPVRSIGLKRPLDTYHFFPLEPSFDIKLKSGFYLDNNRRDGIVFVDFSMSLRTLGINDELSGDKIGCTVEVKIQTLLDFFDDLAHEVKAIFSTET